MRRRSQPVRASDRDGDREGDGADRARSAPPARTWDRLWGGAAFGPFRRVGTDGYDPEFFGESEGRGDGAGSRRYREVDRGLIGGGAAETYGVGREMRDYLGGPLERDESIDIDGDDGEEEGGEGRRTSAATDRLD